MTPLLTLNRSCISNKGHALVYVMVLSAVSFLVLGGALSWSSTNHRLMTRHVQYHTAAAAAEAATEKVLSKMISDYKIGGETVVYDNLNSYRTSIPSTNEGAYWKDFVFNDGNGNSNKIFVERIVSEVYTNLDSQYRGLKGWASTYRVMANATQAGQVLDVPAAVCQDVQVASIPLFQFSIFYGVDLEVHSLTDMDIIGRVHCNGNIFTSPSAKLVFWSDATAVKSYFTTRKPGDPAYSAGSTPSGTITFKAKKDSKVASLNLPVGTNNTPEAVRQILEVPPSGEDASSTMGKQRYYNRSQVVIRVGTSSVTAFARNLTTQTTNAIPYSQLSYILTTNLSFTDQREGKTVRVTEIDVSRLSTWSTTNSVFQASVNNSGNPVSLIYVSDERPNSSSYLSAVRLKNGQTLPSKGLTVSTPNPLYVKGHYNQPNSSHLQTTNTTQTKPAALVSDALTVLSSSWDDTKSSQSYQNRVAANTTLNAALITGLVETTNSPAKYSGGVHNLGRFLEDWSGKNFTYNGSIVVIYPSAKGTGTFQQPGAYYEPPTRDYAFDLNFMDITKLPPGTPEVRALIRSSWNTVRTGTTNVVATN